MASVMRVEALKLFCTSGRWGKQDAGTEVEGLPCPDQGKGRCKRLRIISFVIRLTIGFSKLTAYQTSCEAIHPPPEKILLAGQRRGALAFIGARLGAFF